MFDLSGQTALVTGASGGIGGAIARALHGQGAEVMVAGTRRDALDALAAELGARSHVGLADLGDPAGPDRLVKDAEAVMGRVDILVNNAGMSPLAPSLVETTEALFDKVIDINFKGPFRLSSLIGERMMAGNGGAIILLSSTASYIPMPHTIPYGGAKAAINSMTVALAKLYGPKIRVNCICPGPFLTDVSTAWRDDKAAQQRLGLKRFGNPEEIVGTALYLASDASSYTTGQVIRVDGGSW